MGLPTSFSDIPESLFEEISMIAESICPNCGSFRSNVWVLTRLKKKFEEAVETAMIAAGLIAGLPVTVGAAGAGATKGALIGSVLGPVGTAVGGLLGGLVGGAIGAAPSVVIIKITSNIIADSTVKQYFKDNQAFLKCQNCSHSYIP